ncbi:NAD(P)-dependent oxidoreductase [Rhodococcoides kyotonense]|uniref:Putative NADH-flavin reductase n=1 Tax=Rhodococcoides kyotonense TaxID=398843 RepID=A0A239MS69_9NOCA|nr:NAD(P)H-binding protein [Rhodococcus kyotonensis]SNT44944.1 Putative NADH-flavin reductase [Rhodococcus kyotonensis]
MSNHTNRIVVLGAGGRTGRLIVDTSLRAGHDTLAVVRSPERADLPPHDRLEVGTGDALDVASLERLLRAGDVVVSAIGPSGRKSNGLYTNAAHAVVGATARTGAHRLVAITSSGVRSDDPGHPWWYRRFLVPFMRNTYHDMARMESVVGDSPLDWTFVRPGRLLDEPATGDYRVENEANPAGGIGVPRQDVADFVIACAEDDTWSRKYPTITR